MAQYSNPDKQRQPEGYELNKSELSDADFTGKLLEFYDDTYLDLPSFAELVGYDRGTVASWLGERTPTNSGLPSPEERAKNSNPVGRAGRRSEAVAGTYP
jgi:hypothetical protein